MSSYLSRTIVSLIAVLLVQAATAIADPGPLGPEFPADDRALPENNWHTVCVDDAGITTSLEREHETCTGAETDEVCVAGDELLLYRKDSAGNPIGRPLAIADDPVVFAGYRLICLRSGPMVAQWQDGRSGCFMHRALDAAGNPVRLPQRTAPSGYSCGKRANLTLHRSGEFFAVWEEADSEISILLQHFDSGGRSVGDVVTVADEIAGIVGRPKVSVDAAGLGVVVWQARASGDVPDPIFARFLTAGSQPLGEAFQVNTFVHGSAEDPAVVSEGGGEFVVLWSNLLQGGRVGRRISIIGGLVTTDTTTTTTLPRPENMPRFGAAQIVDSTLSPQPELTENRVMPSDVGSWLLEQANERIRSTVDDGKNWSRSMPVVDSDDGGLAALGTDGVGTWVGLQAGRDGSGVGYVRSTDKGANWSTPRSLSGIDTWSEDCVGCGRGEAAIAGSAIGTWVAAWSYNNLVEDPDTGELSSRFAIAAVRATKGGTSWKRFTDVAVDRGLGRFGFDLSTDGQGSWVLIWADEDLWFVNSRDDAVTWSEPKRLASKIVCTGCALHARYRRVSAAGDGRGNWIAAFASPLLDPERWGYDADIFVMRSSDAGATWSAPTPLLPDSATDGSRDLFPSVATDRTGRWLVTFTSYRPFRGPQDMDADVVVSMSIDGGFSWSPAFAVNEDAAADAVGDLAPTLTADERGVWMTAWRALTFEPEGDIVAERVHLATADAECGNRRVDPAEQCDDGNRDDDDGCDSNCTVSVCGNGIPTVAEECDDANETEDDFCLGDCRFPFCGDGIRAPGIEECDDGNLDDSDECVGDCRRARCGDGHLWQDEEECDDGNGNSFDGCTNRCELPFCGDGFVSATEECDDGNRDNDDWCVDDCVDAFCGDGYVNVFAERCDFAIRAQSDICDVNCGVPEACGDADGSGQVTSGDVQRILGSAVGLDVVCPLRACDVDGSGTVSSPDAQRGLSLAVGLDAGEDCSLGAGDVTFFIESADLIGSFQLDVHYGLSGGDFVGFSGNVLCTNLVRGALVSFNDDEAQKTLRMGYISIAGFQTPTDLVRCRFNVPLDAPTPIFQLDVVDAASVGFVPIVSPAVRYRLSSGLCRDEECEGADCGNGIVDPGESCDDGNRSNEDSCTDVCRPAVCGDGYVEQGVEECDDRNDDNDDGCTNSCSMSGCGNGRLEDGEQCDDGNGSNTDFCLNNCTNASCGDGFLNPDTESCDPADPATSGSCASDCHDTDGCEDDGSECAIGGDWIIFSVDGPSRLGSLQFSADYTGAGFRFFGRDGEVKCAGLINAVLSSFNDDQGQTTDILQAGFITHIGFSTPRDVAACRVAIAPDAPRPDIAITVVDAADDNVQPVFPLPTMNYRLYRSAKAP